jgi:protein subunit release factor B
VKQLLFSVTIRDCVVDTFCTGGNGGQHRNATKNGVRVTHPPSGAVGEHRDGRDQPLNKRAAFRKMAESQRFKAWHRIETARRLGQKSVDQLVDEAMAPHLVKVEARGEDGRWGPAPDSSPCDEDPGPALAG